MHDPIPTKISGASCDDGATGEGVCMGRCKGVCGTRPLSTGRHAPTADDRNEAITSLERLRKRYKEAGKMIEAKAIAQGIRVLRRGAE